MARKELREEQRLLPDQIDVPLMSLERVQEIAYQIINDEEVDPVELALFVESLRTNLNYLEIFDVAKAHQKLNDLEGEG
jgi:hypothetical protein